jgi:hypothetical protein
MALTVYLGDMMDFVQIVEKNENGQIEAGVNFWHSPGESSCLYQLWEYRASGIEYKATCPDPVLTSTVDGMTDLEYTVLNCWAAQMGMEVEKVERDYR